jgi:protease-4
MKRTICMLLSLSLFAGISGCTLLKVSLVEEVQPLTETVVSGSGRDKVLLLDITGVIMGGESGSPLSDRKKPGLIARVREALERARKDRDVKAVVLRISSPGGGVTASDMLYRELRTYRQETGVVMIAHVVDIGTSGAYYAALAADAITAQPTSVNGSIGVIMYRVDATGLMEKVGLKTTEIHAGELKGLGSPFRHLSDDERKIFQGFIDSLYDRFTGLVAESRKLSPEAVRKIADGRIYTSDEAKTAGLIDGIGYLDDAIALAKKKAGITEAKVVMYRRPGEYRNNIYSMNAINIDLGEIAEPGAKFLYLWVP